MTKRQIESMESIFKVLPDWPAPESIHAFVTERTGGFSGGKFASLNLAYHVDDDSRAVECNRDLLQSSVPVNLTFQWLNQIHSNIANIVRVPTSPIKGDSLVCREPGIVCCVLTADCLPIFLTNTKGTEIAVIHAGWRGICQGILANTVNEMSSHPGDLMAWLGPAIGPCHYEVGGDLKDIFRESIDSKELWAEIEECFGLSSTAGKFFLDLYKTAAAIFRHLGITDIYGGNYCTFSDEDKFYSYRRDKETGRMVSAIFIEPGC